MTVLPAPPTMIRMTVPEWIAVPDCPRQRNTVFRAAKAKHLRSPSPAHFSVSMAVLPDGGRFKLDGHTRAHLWATGEVPAPAEVVVTVYPCPDLEAVETLYTHFDSKSAVESTRDEVFGLLNALGATMGSEVLKNGNNVVTPVRLVHSVVFGEAAMRATPLRRLLSVWLPELVEIDRVNPTRFRFSSGLIAAALLTIGRDGARATDFWSRHERREGVKRDGRVDALQALDDKVGSIKASGTAGSAKVRELMLYGVAAYDAHLRGADYLTRKNGSGIRQLGPAAFDEFVEAVRGHMAPRVR